MPEIENTDGLIPESLDALVLSGPDDSIFDSIFDWILNAIRDIIGVVGDEIIRVSDKVGEITVRVINAIGQNTNTIINTIGTQLTHFTNTVGQNITSIVNAAGVSLTAVINASGKAITSVVNAVGTNLVNVINVSANALRLLINTVGANLALVINTIGNNITKVIDVIGANAVSIINAVGANAALIINSIKGLIQAANNELRADLTAITEFLKTDLPEIIKNMSGAFREFLLDFASWIPSLLATIWGWVSRDIPGHSPWYDGVLAALANAVYSSTVGYFVGALKFLTPALFWLVKTVVSPITGAILTMFDDFVTGIIDATAPVGAMSPEHGLDIMRTLNVVSTTVLTGLLGLSIAGELSVIATKLGFGHVSAMIYDLTNYKVLTGALVTALSAAAVATPLRHYYLNKFRTNIPSIRDAMDFYASDDIALAGLSQILGYLGIPDNYHAAYADSAYRSPSPFQLRSAAADGAFNEDIFAEELRRAGYHPNVRKMFMDSFKKSATTDLKSVMISEATGRYKSGITDVDGLSAELKILNVGDSLIPLYVAGAQLGYNTAIVNDMSDAFTAGVRSGNLSLEEYRGQLSSLGLRPDIVEAKVLIEKMRIKPTADKTPIGLPGEIYLTDAGKIEVDTIRIRRRKNTITRTQELTELQNIGMPEDYAVIIANNDGAHLMENIDLEPPAVVPPYKTDEGKIKLSTVRSSRRKNTIDRTEELTQLAALGVPEYLAKAYADNDDVALEEKIPTETAPGVPVYETEPGKIKVDTIRRARRKNAITAADERHQLIVLGMADWLADVYVENDTVRMASKEVEE